MARHCVQWRSGKKPSKRKGSRRGKKHCPHGVVKKGRRKGRCLKHKRARR